MNQMTPNKPVKTKEVAEVKTPSVKASSESKKDFLQTPKGMRDIMDDTYYEMQGLFEKAQEVAVYYGFKPINTSLLEHEEIFLKGAGEGSDIADKELYTLRTKGGDRLALRPEGTAGVMRAYIEHGMKSLPQPVMLYYCEPMFRHDRPQKGRYREHHQFGIEILGTTRAIADALIIRATLTILAEAGAKDLSIDLNSIGDKDSRKEYEKELKNYYRSHINALPPIDRQRLKTNVLRVLDSKEPKTIAINENAPDSISFLSEASKKHFKEVLEYLEEMKVPYRLNKSLVRGLDYYTDTVFEVMEEVTEEDGTKRSVAICGGGRYNYLARAIGYPKDIPGVGVGIGMERVVESAWWKHLRPRIMKKPKVYFIQLGFDAKLKSLNVIEILRTAHIPVYQALSKDNLRSQLGQAEKMEIPYTIIFGQKEAMEGSVIVRDMNTRSQSTVKIDKLCEYLKHLK